MGEIQTRLLPTSDTKTAGGSRNPLGPRPYDAHGDLGGGVDRPAISGNQSRISGDDSDMVVHSGGSGSDMAVEVCRGSGGEVGAGRV